MTFYVPEAAAADDLAIEECTLVRTKVTALAHPVTKILNIIPVRGTPSKVSGLRLACIKG